MPLPSIFFKLRRGQTGILGVQRLLVWQIVLAVVLTPCGGCAGSRASPPASPAASGTAAHPSLPALRPVLPAPAAVRVDARVTIAAVGDVLIHEAVKQTASDHRAPGNDDGFAWLWSPVADLLAASDLTFANLETPIAPAAGRGSHSFVFNAAPAVVSALRHSGVRLLNVANNHLFDQGRPGFEETLAHLETLGMPYIGAGAVGKEAGPRLMEVNGIRVAFLGFAHFFNQSGNDCPPGQANRCLKASLLDPDRAVAAVQAAARTADAVVVSLHWGNEYEQSRTYETVGPAIQQFVVNGPKDN